MPVNGFTVGRDTTVNMTGPNGTNIILPPDQVTNFDAKPLKREDVSRPLNSPPKFLYMPDGWRLTIEADRKDASLDQYMADVEQAFWAGAAVNAGTVFQTITEPDGSVTQWQYEGCQFWVEELGNYRADGKVAQRIEGAASRRRRVG